MNDYELDDEETYGAVTEEQLNEEYLARHEV